MPCNIIRDGYTKRAKINGRPGIFGDLTFVFRPMLDEEVETVLQRSGQKKAAGRFTEATGIKAAAIVRQLKEWDETDEDGNPVPITIENVRHLPPALLGLLLDVICGYIAGDLPADATPTETDEYARSLEAALDTGSASTAEKDEKN
jgi:hypothetical protein